MKGRQQLYVLIFAAILLTIGVCFLVKSPPLGKIDRVIFVTIDTLRADHVGVYGYPRNVTPFIDNLAGNGVVFEKAFSAAPHTAPSHATMFTALYPFQHNVLRNHEVLDPSIFTLAKAVESSDMRVAAFTSVKFLEGKVGMPFEDGVSNRLDKKFKKHWYRSATNVVDNALAWIREQSKDDDFLVWLHFYDVHQWAGKKNMPAKFRDEIEKLPQAEHLEFLKKHHNTPVSFFGSEEKTLNAINGYDARLLYVDNELKRLSDSLAAEGKNENLLWVITSDHGEGLGNHNYEGHGQFLYQEQLHIPLIFAFSDSRLSPHKNSSLVRTVDLLPTLVEALGASAGKAAAKWQGSSLVPLIQGKDSLSHKNTLSFAERRPKDEISFRRTWEDGEVYSLHDLKAKVVEHSNGVDEFYDLEKDPFEESNQSGNKNPLEERLRHSLGNLFDPSMRMSTKEQSPQTPEELEELKSLGYL